MAAAEEGGGGGGAGGKFRKRPFRRSHATPYDRPLTAFRPSASSSNGSWLSKLVDPASRLLTSGAHRLFASVFRKRLPAPPPPPTSPSPPPPLPPPQESNQAQRSKIQGAVPTSLGSQEKIVVEGGNLNGGSDCGSISELEQILKQKTFTSSQIDRLTDLLHAKTLDENAEKRSKDVHLEANGIERDKFAGIVSAPFVRSKIGVISEDADSSAELARAYMGSRALKTPSVFKENRALLNCPSSLANSPTLSYTSPAPGSSFCSGLPNDGFRTSNSFNRSGIYRMARTPYSRVLPKAASRLANEASKGPLSFQSMWEQRGPSESRQVQGLKRRSSVLDDDIGSVGPIRRIRQKSNLLAEKRLSSSGAHNSILGTSSSDVSSFALSLRNRPLLLDKSEHMVSTAEAEGGDKCISGGCFTSVPSQASETAAKILEHLDKMVSSSPSKTKSLEVKLAAAREAYPGKLTKNMMQGQALRSLESVETPKFLLSVEDEKKLDISPNASLPDNCNSVSSKQGKVEEKIRMESAAACDSIAPKLHGLNSAVPIDDIMRTSDSEFSNVVTNSSHEKRAFRMCAHEDHLDLDDDDYTNGAASAVLANSNGTMDTSGSRASAAEAVRIEKTSAFSETKSPSEPIMNKKLIFETSDVSVVSGENTSSTHLSEAPKTTVQSELLVSQSTSGSKPMIPPKETIANPLFDFGSENVRSVSNVIYPPSCVDKGSHSPASLTPKSKASSSFASDATGHTENNPDSDRCDAKSSGKGGELFNKPDTPITAGASMLPSPTATASTSSTSIFSFGISGNKSSLNNDSHSSSPMLSPALAPGANGYTNLKSNSSLSAAPIANMFSSTATPTEIVTSSSGMPSLSGAASGPLVPAFKFESAVAPLSASPSSSPVSATLGAKTAVAEAKTTQERPGSQTTTFSFGSTSTSASAGSLFKFSASGPSSTANNYSQVSTVGSESLVDAQASSSGSSVAATQSMPLLFGSSATLPSCGLSSSTPGSSSFSSAATNIFSSGGVFGLGSSAPASESKSNSSLGDTTSAFSSSWQPPKSPIFSSTHSSASPSTVFTFGSSSTSASASSSVPVGFGSIVGSFSAAAPVSNSASMAFGSIGGSSSASGPASNSAPVAFGSIGGSSSSVFSFTSAAVTPSPFSSLPPSQPVFPFGSGASGNNDQMNMEDSMAEDNAQAPTPVLPAFGQPTVTSQPGFMFGSSASSGMVPFQFGGQQNQATPNPNTFQSSGSLNFSAGGSFSLGSSGADKSSRKIIKVKHKQRRK